VPVRLRGLAECTWGVRGPRRARILPDGCMDLIEADGAIVVAGPDTRAFISDQRSEQVRGIRFRPGILPRLLGVPGAELRNCRVPLSDLRPELAGATLSGVTAALLCREPGRETAPWPVPQLAEVTALLAGGAAVSAVADEIGWSARSMQRQCAAVYGYGPTTLRRVLRFRRAVALLRSGVSAAQVANRAGYADQPHLHREVRELAGLPLSELRQTSSGAYRSTTVPSGSVTLA
jgi:AraC-like DNA-binding protein